MNCAAVLHLKQRHLSAFICRILCICKPSLFILFLRKNTYNKENKGAEKSRINAILPILVIVIFLSFLKGPGSE